MHTHDVSAWQHDHDVPAFDRNESRTRLVVAITASMMVVELAAGWATGSMALLADGWHMATHAGALGLTVGGYWFARRFANAPTLTFGPGKVFALAGFTSAVTLAIVAILMMWESVWRLLDPGDIHFDEALVVAAVGLLVNLGSALLLGHGHDHGDQHVHGDHHGDHGDHHDHHDHGDHEHGGHHEDLNLRAAYLHVLADALTSVLAIVALLGGRTLGWSFLDPLMGIVGALVILRWSWGLLSSAGGVLLDAAPGTAALHRAREALEAIDDVKVADLHLWSLSPGRLACVATVVTHAPRPVQEYHEAVERATGAAHVTIEVRACDQGAEDGLGAVSSSQFSADQRTAPLTPTIA